MPSNVSTRMILAACVVASTNQAGAAETADDFVSMFTEGQAALNLRYRYEYVDQDGIDEEAKASTLRTRLTFTTADFNGFTAQLEFDDLSSIGDDDYNSTANGNTEFPVVADPEGTDINQVWVKYAAAGAAGTLGRQRINHDNQRFIGGVAWRQNEQTYEGLRGTWATDFGFSADVSYIDTVNRIFGPDDGPAQPAELQGDNYFLHANWKFLENHKITGYAYLLDIDEEEGYPAGRSVGNSSDTYGIEYSGKFGPVAARLGYADQTDAGDNPVEYDAEYYIAEAMVTVAGIKGTLGYEVLGGGDGVGFKTPYATLHKFQGWADKFLVTPADGIEDAYVGLSGKVGPVALGAFYHDFQAEDTSEDFGTEINLIATWVVDKNWLLQLKYADFSTDSDSYTDTEKAWLTVNFKI